MSKTAPLFGLDAHPEYQSGLDFERVRELGYRFAFVKASQAAGYVPPGLRAYFRQVKDASLVPGLYHFLDSTAGARAQADNFLRQVEAAGGPGGLLLAADFEAYGNQSPSNALLGDFVSEVKRRTGGHPIIVYTTKSFWEGGDPSGPFSKYGADALWAAHYADMARHDRPQEHFRALKGWGWDTIGGREADIHQFTSTGLVAGHYMDVNAAKATRDELLTLTRPPRAKPEPAPKEDAVLPDWVRDPLVYLEKTLGGPYVAWKSGPFTTRAPAWVRNSPPLASEVRREGAFCAAMLTLALRVNGIPLPTPQDPEWEGGLLDYGRDWIEEQKIAIPYESGMKLRPGDAGIWKYRGSDLDEQGHTFIQGRRGTVIQADVPGGINEQRTVAETIRMFGHGRKLHIIRREKWLRP